MSTADEHQGKMECDFGGNRIIQFFFISVFFFYGLRWQIAYEWRAVCRMFCNRCQNNRKNVTLLPRRYEMLIADFYKFFFSFPFFLNEADISAVPHNLLIPHNNTEISKKKTYKSSSSVFLCIEEEEKTLYSIINNLLSSLVCICVSLCVLVVIFIRLFFALLLPPLPVYREREKEQH